MNEGYQIPPQKPYDEQLIDMIKAIIEQFPKDRRYFQEAVEAALFCRLGDRERFCLMSIIGTLIPGFKKPSTDLPQEEKKEEPEIRTGRRGRSRKWQQIQAANVIPFKPRQSA